MEPQLAGEGSRMLRLLCGGLKPRKDPPRQCLMVPPDIVKRPDPAIYSQALELRQGREPRWDSPDVLTHALPDFTVLNELRVTVHNLSTETTAFNTHVHLAWSDFGIGLNRQILAILPATIAPGGSRQLEFVTSQALKDARRFSLFVSVRHPYDEEPGNNHGSQAFDSQRTGDVGRNMVFQFPLRNPFSSTTVFALHVNPVKWNADVSPISVPLNPGQQTTVQVSITVPPEVGAGAREFFSVYALSPAGLAGGVALIVNVD